MTKRDLSSFYAFRMPKTFVQKGFIVELREFTITRLWLASFVRRWIRELNNLVEKLVFDRNLSGRSFLVPQDPKKRVRDFISSDRFGLLDFFFFGKLKEFLGG